MPESSLCRDVLLGLGVYRRPDVVVVVVDACNLTRNLVLVAELVGTGRPVIVALNMVDLAQRRGLSLDATKLGALIGCDVVPMVARKGIGVDEVREKVATAMKSAGRRQDDVRRRHARRHSCRRRPPTRASTC